MFAAGKWWGHQDSQPIIALHGWLDNAASFDPLIALLPKNLNILALDLPGHGKSAHYPSCGMFHFTEDICTIRYILRQFGWKNLTFLGHSLGSNYSFIFASLYPNAVKRYIGLDILRPFCVDIENFVKAGGADIDRFLDYENNKMEPPEYTMEQLIEHKYKESRKTINRESCEILLSRGTYPSQKQQSYFGLSRDMRLKIWFYHSFPHDCLVELTSRVKCEVLSIQYKSGARFDKPEHIQQTLDILRVTAKKFEHHVLDGSHHAHMNNPEQIATIVTNFINL
ncbi:hypothetical protein B566_EDAN003673 [Ephemera danica]|nr:hypothetical protein B566_EDAN003673 [Ephemera danica]